MTAEEGPAFFVFSLMVGAQSRVHPELVQHLLHYLWVCSSHLYEVLKGLSHLSFSSSVPPTAPGTS